MEDLGAQIAYVVLPAGVPVYDSDGNQVGLLEHVMAHEGDEDFHGLIVRTTTSPPRQLYADYGQVATLHQHGVVLSVPGAELHDPGENPEAGETAASTRQESLRRAWDWVRHPR